MSLQSQLVNNWATTTFLGDFLLICKYAKTFPFFKKRKVVILSPKTSWIFYLFFDTLRWVPGWQPGYSSHCVQTRLLSVDDWVLQIILLEFASPPLHVVGQVAGDSIRDVSGTSLHVVNFKTSTRWCNPIHPVPSIQLIAEGATSIWDGVFKRKCLFHRKKLYWKEPLQNLKFWEGCVGVLHWTLLTLKLASN